MNPWTTIFTFRDGSTYRQRGLNNPDGTFASIEERIFNADGTLRPLPNGRTSPADHERSQV
jgi:hypothetical protein